MGAVGLIMLAQTVVLFDFTPSVYPCYMASVSIDIRCRRRDSGSVLHVCLSHIAPFLLSLAHNVRTLGSCPVPPTKGLRSGASRQLFQCRAWVVVIVVDVVVLVFVLVVVVGSLHPKPF